MLLAQIWISCCRKAVGKGGSRKEEAPAAILARDDGGLDQGGGCMGVEVTRFWMYLEESTN